ncbi:MAG TPA: M17 family peptidase N-terminal domain-containing protein [Steroidobacter sp.]|nr:M17 family peptidase N-terminal domain-containing protein [Steroidobacter sp.]
MAAEKRAAVRSGASAGARPADIIRREPIRLSARNAAEAGKADVLAVGAFGDGTLPPTAQALDARLDGRLADIVKRVGPKSKAGETTLLYDASAEPAQRILLVELGARDAFDDGVFIKALTSAAKALADSDAREIAFALADLDAPQRTLAWRVQQASRILADGFYKFAAPKAEVDKAVSKRDGGVHATLLVSEAVSPTLEFAVSSGRAIAEGVALTKDLGNLPGNVCHPAYLAEAARELGKTFSFPVEVLERDDMAKLGMESALSVGRASEQPCRLIVMKYLGGAKGDKPIVLIGKGVTFDTGGVSLKPGEDLDMMKYDMCGAASVFGAIKAVARLALPLNVIGVVGAVENMPGAPRVVRATSCVRCRA